MEETLRGTWRITMVLPVWTVVNELTLTPEAGGVLNGSLNTMDGNAPIPITHGRWNKNHFLIRLSVGPGQLLLTGTMQGDALSGVVVIDDTPDLLTGTKIPVTKQ